MMKPYQTHPSFSLVYGLLIYVQLFFAQFLPFLFISDLIYVKYKYFLLYHA